MKPFPKAEKVTEVTARMYKNVRAVARVRVHRREAVVLHRLDDRFRSVFSTLTRTLASPYLPYPSPVMNISPVSRVCGEFEIRALRAYEFDMVLRCKF